MDKSKNYLLQGEVSLKDMNSKFYIVAFKGGRVCLVDDVRKELRWIKSWQTALDLDFIGEWTNIDVDITKPLTPTNTAIETKDGKKLDLKDFKYARGIHTQGAPGT